MTERQHILIHGINYRPELIGIGPYTADLAEFLAAQGSSVEVVTAVPHYPGWQLQAPYRNRYRIETLNGVRIYRVPLVLRPGVGIWRLLVPLSFAIAAVAVVIWRVLRIRPDVAICIEPTLFVAPVLLIAAKLVGARCVLHVQDLEIDAAFAVGHLRNKWLQSVALKIESLLLRRFDLVITISNRMRDRLAAKGVATDRLRVIRNWVDLTRIRYLSGPNRYRAMLGLEGKFVVLYSGHLGPKQALWLLLEAARRLTREEQICFVIAGDGPSKAALTERYGGLANVRFLSLQPEEALCELLNLADLHAVTQDKQAADLVLPSKLGGILASGRPLVVTADEGTEIYDLLAGAARVVPAGDPDALALAIQAAQKDRQPPPPAFRSLAGALSKETVLPAFYREICRAGRDAG